jgi:hypothetical protein
VLEGILRKKGLVFNNERIVKLFSDGVLRYYDRAKPSVVKNVIDLKSQLVTHIRFEYAGRP